MINYDFSNEIEVIELSKKLISFPSVTPNDEGLIDYLSEVLTRMGFDCTVLDFGEGENNVKNIYARLGSESPNLCFAVHTDVVPPGDLNKWDSDPFTPLERDGVLYGRGASDMKTGIAAVISAISELLNEKAELNGSISFLATNDEEKGLGNGTESVVKYLHDKDEHIDLCIVADVISSKKLGEEISIGNGGSITFELTCYGKQVHPVAFIEEQDNAIINMVSILYKINHVVLDEGNDLFPASTCKVVKINTDNNADNILPSSVQATFNIRYNNEHTKEELYNSFEEICNSITSNYDLIIKHVDDNGYSVKLDNNSKMLAEAVAKITGYEPQFIHTLGLTDGRFMNKICPYTYVFGLSAETAHQTNENINIQDVKDIKTIFKNFIQDFLR